MDFKVDVVAAMAMFTLTIVVAAAIFCSHSAIRLSLALL